MDRYRFQILNGNVLKLFALMTMTIDHIGMIMFPRQLVWRLIGRLAFPVFAYMIAEGCYYTRNKKKYIGLIFAVGVLCQIVAFFSQHSLYMCIMITFTLSVLIIFSLQRAIPDRNREGGAGKINILWCVITAAVIAACVFFTIILPKLLPDTDLKVDYGFFGVMLPVAVYIPNLFMKRKDAACRIVQVIFLAIWLIPVWLTCNRYEWIALFSAIPLLFYNGERGRLNLKYLFYVYYPAHLGIIYLISMIR